MNLVVDKKRGKYIIFDIDGTLANVTHRLHHISTEGQKPNWDAFNDAMVEDTIENSIAQIYYRMCACKHMVNYSSIFVTGRPETHRKQTEQWLMSYKLIPDYLFMRPAGDYRPDVEIKEEILDKYIQNADILFVVDDRQGVVDMWRRHGYKVLQCQKGDF